MRVRIEKAVSKKITQKAVVKPALYAHVCDGCGKRFDMDHEPHTRSSAGVMDGIFDSSVVGPDGRGMGNMFQAAVCSFACADKVYTGGWKKMKEYAPYAKHRCKLERVGLSLTRLFTETELRAKWKSAPARTLLEPPLLDVDPFRRRGMGNLGNPT